MAKKSPFTLTFVEALELIMKEGAWVQGQNFKNGKVLMMKGGYGVDSKEHLHIHDFNSKPRENPKEEVFVSINLYHDKFRRVSTEIEAKNKPNVNVLTGLIID